DHAVHQIDVGAAAAEDEERVVVAAEGRLEEPDRRPGEGLLIGLQRGGDHHVERKQPEADEQARRQVESGIAHAAEPAHRPGRDPNGDGAHAASRYSRRRTKICATMVTMTIMTTDSAAAKPRS